MIVDLHRGPSVTERALVHALDLERRGISLRLDETGALRFSGPRARFTEADARAVERYRNDIKAILAYCETHGG